MHVKDREIIDSEEYLKSVCDGGKRWKNGEFCKHENEPFVMVRVVDKNDKHGILSEHVGIVQPSCDVCIKRSKGHQITTIFNGKVALVISSVDFFMKFIPSCIKFPKEDEVAGHSCESYADSGENFNRHGDLCWKCRELNSTTIDHGDAHSEIFLDKIGNAGPSVMLRFYMNHEGECKFGLPLFNDPGVSTLDVGNVP